MMALSAKTLSAHELGISFRAPITTTSVNVTGEFNHWLLLEPMRFLKEENGFLIFFLGIPIPEPKQIEKFEFKFVVDGKWMCSTEYPTKFDGLGNENNVFYYGEGLECPYLIKKSLSTNEDLAELQSLEKHYFQKDSALEVENIKGDNLMTSELKVENLNELTFNKNSVMEYETISETIPRTFLATDVNNKELLAPVAAFHLLSVQTINEDIAYMTSPYVKVEDTIEDKSLMTSRSVGVQSMNQGASELTSCVEVRDIQAASLITPYDMKMKDKKENSPICLLPTSQTENDKKSGNRSHGCFSINSIFKIIRRKFRTFSKRF
ncbi:hypothetical protein HMI54_010372 [Coelomomyces lativittatus]|nr:hypothetical protein HMI54_010372 [Coelomomyces lativittatus]KAJ1515340.1 hypothetical protein HMI56_005656 [Coelomomyces lativittatus]